jgi:cob(I)alamin adenosyltransferase
VTDAGPGTRPAIESIVATGRGDDGTTGLLYGGDRIRKDDLRTEAYGTIDEAVAALGLARAHLAEAVLAAEAAGILEAAGLVRAPNDMSTASPGQIGLGDLAALILRLQRELFVAAAELATNPDAWDRLADGTTRVSDAMVAEVETILLDHESRIVMPREFVVPGETLASAALEVARTILRRAERRAVTLDAAGLVPGRHLVRYLNRLADLLWVLARAAEQAESRTATPSRAERSTRTSPPIAKK